MRALFRGAGKESRRLGKGKNTRENLTQTPSAAFLALPDTGW
jgi:hypothetical protein